MFCRPVFAEESATKAPSPPLPPEASAPDVNKSEPVKLERVVVKEEAGGAAATFNDKLGTEALTEVVSGAAMRNPTAQSSSDLMKNMSGVAVNKSGDGSSKVSVRGLDQRLLRITVDGQRQGGTGNPLDNIPPEIVQSLEVTKAFTPDMEADAVGGVINVNTGGTVLKAAFEQGRHQLTYNSLESRPGTRNSFTTGQPFRLFSEQANASILATASFDDQYKVRERVSDLREWTPQISPGPAPFSGQSLPVLTLPVIEATLEHRQRTGALINSDARFGAASVFFHANFNRDWAKRNRNLNDTDPSGGRVLSLTPTAGTFAGVRESRRNQQQISQRDAANFSFGGKATRGNADFDLTFGYALTHEFEPDTEETVFLSDHTYRAGYDFSRNAFAPVFTAVDETDPADTASISDPAHYRFSYLSITRVDTKDAEGSAKFNAKIHLGETGASENYFKFGGKIQQRHRTANTDRDVYNAGSLSRDLTGLVETSSVTTDTLNYRFGPVPNAGAVAALVPTAPAVFRLDPTQTLINSSSADYTVTETVWALYAMGKLKRERWSLRGGVRVEGTRLTSKANQMVLGPTGAVQGFVPSRAESDYLQVLPGLHLRYDAPANLLWRGSITRSLSRPSYSDVAPFQTFSFLDHRSRIGNPALKPYQATNVDFSVDKFSDALGLFSVAFFYKKIDHFIADEQTPVTVGSLGQFIQFDRVNGDSALAMGFETNWQSVPWEMPHGLGRGSMTVNYSFTHGEAHYPTRPGETFPLPDQVTYQGGATFRWERGRFSFEGAARYRSKWWEDLIAPGFDNYLKGYWDAEVSAAYKIGKDARVTFGVGNLLDVPMRRYAGTLAHMSDYQRNGVDCTVGFQWKR